MVKRVSAEEAARRSRGALESYELIEFIENNWGNENEQAMRRLRKMLKGANEDDISVKIIPNLNPESGAAAVLENWLAVDTAESVAGFVTKTVAGEVGGRIDQTLYEKFLDFVPESVKNAPGDYKKAYSLLDEFMRTNDPTRIIDAERERGRSGEIERSAEVARKELAPTGGLGGTQPGQELINYGSNYINNTYREQDQTRDKSLDGATRSELLATSSLRPLETQPQNIPEPVITSYIDPMLPKAEQERLLIEQTRTLEAPTIDSLKNSWNMAPNRYDSKQHGPRDLARLIIDSSRELVKTLNPIKANLTVLETNPQSFSLMSKVTGYLASKSLPNTEEYKKIAAVYNGRSIDFSSFSIARNAQTSLIEVTGIDETGAALTLPQTTGTILPAVPGTVFMGPLSANDRLPTEGRVEDYFSFFHDYSWKDQNFNRLGDLQFISRLSQNLDRVRPENRALVQSTIIYFTNVSLTLGLLKGQKSTSREETGDGESSGEDIFDVLGMVDKSEVSPGTYEELKDEFYSVMQEEMTNYQKTEGFFTSFREHYVDNLVNNLEIQLN
ncbi:hypothetical protein BASA81_018243 [Batrachochytrium salamandrivorans]|nr:hypothetical protein BASA81_018243 [Batrachochytrium salamandrivorans]